MSEQDEMPAPEMQEPEEEGERDDLPAGEMPEPGTEDDQ